MLAVLGMFAILSLKNRHSEVIVQSAMFSPVGCLVSDPATPANKNCLPDESALETAAFVTLRGKDDALAERVHGGEARHLF
jgi:hypothetical protein